MPWHQSLSNPRKVYNERHEQVCVCETPEQAALIVEAVNANRAKPLESQPYTETRPARAAKEQRGKPREIDLDDGSFAIV